MALPFRNRKMELVRIRHHKEQQLRIRKLELRIHQSIRHRKVQQLRNRKLELVHIRHHKVQRFRSHKKVQRHIRCHIHRIRHVWRTISSTGRLGRGRSLRQCYSHCHIPCRMMERSCHNHQHIRRKKQLRCRKKEQRKLTRIRKKDQYRSLSHHTIY